MSFSIHFIILSNIFENHEIFLSGTLLLIFFWLLASLVCFNVDCTIKPIKRMTKSWFNGKILINLYFFLCSPEVFSLAVNYMDRVLSQVNISKHQFQLLGSVCIFLASKFKESSPLCAEKLVICSDFSFTTEEIMVSFANFFRHLLYMPCCGRPWVYLYN